MNKTPEYIDAMQLSDIEKAALPKTDIRAVHQALDAEHRTYSREDDSPQGSVKARLEQAWPDSLAKEQLVKDDEGRDQLQAMPKATRTSMFPDPWRTNPVGRFWDRPRLNSPICCNLTHIQLSGISNGTSSAMQTGSFLPIFS